MSVNYLQSNVAQYFYLPSIGMAEINFFIFMIVIWHRYRLLHIFTFVHLKYSYRSISMSHPSRPFLYGKKKYPAVTTSTNRNRTFTPVLNQITFNILDQDLQIDTIHTHLLTHAAKKDGRKRDNDN